MELTTGLKCSPKSCALAPTRRNSRSSAVALTESATEKLKEQNGIKQEQEEKSFHFPFKDSLIFVVGPLDLSAV